MRKCLFETPKASPDKLYIRKLSPSPVKVLGAKRRNQMLGAAGGHREIELRSRHRD